MFKYFKHCVMALALVACCAMSACTEEPENDGDTSIANDAAGRVAGIYSGPGIIYTSAGDLYSKMTSMTVEIYRKSEKKVSIVLRDAGKEFLAMSEGRISTVEPNRDGSYTLVDEGNSSIKQTVNIKGEMEYAIPLKISGVSGYVLIFNGKQQEFPQLDNTPVTFKDESDDPDVARKRNYEANKYWYDKLFEKTFYIPHQESITTYCEWCYKENNITFRENIHKLGLADRRIRYECFIEKGGEPAQWRIENGMLYFYNNQSFNKNANNLSVDAVTIEQFHYGNFWLASDSRGLKLEEGSNGVINLIYNGTVTRMVPEKYAPYGSNWKENYSGNSTDRTSFDYPTPSQTPRISFVKADEIGSEWMRVCFKVENINQSGWINAVQVNYGEKKLDNANSAEWTDNGAVEVLIKNLKPATVYFLQCNAKNSKGQGSSDVIPIATKGAQQ